MNISKAKRVKGRKPSKCVGGVERLAKDTMPVVGLGSLEGAPQYPVSGARCPCKFLGLI